MKQGKNRYCPERGSKPRGLSFAFLFLLLSLTLDPSSFLHAAAPVFQAIGTAAGNFATVSPAWPAHQVDDVALLFVETAGGNAITLTTPSGFVQVSTSPQVTGTGTAGTRMAIYWCRATGSAMAAPSVTVSGDHIYAVIATYRGVIHKDNPWDALSGGIKLTGTASLVAIGTTTTVPETLVTVGVANSYDTNKAFVTSWTNASLTAPTERFNMTINTGGGGGIGVMDGTMASSGTVGATTVGIGYIESNAFITLALKRLTPPNINSLTVGARQLTAGWPDLPSGTTGYTLVAALTQSDPPDLTYANDTAGSPSTVNNPVLTADTTHYIYIRSNGDRESSEWKFYRATCTLVEFDPDQPAFSDASAGSIQFGWSDHGNALDTTKYRVQVSTSSNFLALGGAVVTSSDTYNLFITSSGLAANTTYYFRAAGINHNDVLTGYSTGIGTSTLLAFDPTFNNFTAISTGSARLNWNANGNRAGTTLYRVLTSTSADLSPSISSDTYNNYLSSVGLAANTTVYFRVVALNNNGVPTGYIDASTSTWARAPVFNNFTNTSTGSVRINWFPNGNPANTLYRVLISTLAGMTPAVSSDTYANSLSSAGLAGNTTYYFSVTGINNNGISTATINASTSTWVDKPVTPVFTAVSTGSVLFGWSPAGNRSPGTLYRVLVSTMAGMTPAVSSDTYNTYLSSTGLVSNTAYYFGVAGIGNGGDMTPYTVTAPTSTWARAAVFNNFTQVSTGSLMINWLPNGNPATTLYRVLVSTMSNMTPAVSSDTYNNYLSTAGLPANTTHYFSVTGINNNGISTNTISASTSTWASMAVFNNFTQVSTGSLRLNWLPNGNPVNTLYRVLVSTMSNMAPAVSSDTYNNYLSTAGLPANTTHYFSVMGINNNGVSTNTISASTSTWARAAVFNNFAQVSTGSVVLNWLPNSNPANTLYRVLVSTMVSMTPSVSSDTYNNYLSTAGLAPNTTHYFSVTGINNNAISTNTISASTSTWARMAVFNNFTLISTGSIKLNWLTNSNPATTLYRVLLSTASNMTPAVSSDTYNNYLSTAGLPANTTHYFSVTGINNNGVSTAAVNASTSTWAELPAGLYFTGTTSTTIRLNWSPESNGPGTLFRVIVSTADPSSPAGAVVTTSDTYNTYLSTAGLAPFTYYSFRAATLGNDGRFTLFTASATERTLPTGQMGSPASGSIAAVYVTSITANWALVEGATGYTLAASLLPDLPPAVFASSIVVASLSATVYSPALATDTVHYLFVRANGPAASSAWFAYDPVATRLAFPPAFSGFANGAANSVQFKWLANGNAAATTLYRVLTSTAQDPLAPGGAVVTSSDTYNLTLATAGLAANTTYYFRVAGVNKDGLLTDYILPQSSSTWANAPTQPGFTAVSTGSVLFGWSQAGNRSPGTLYRVLVSTMAGMTPAVSSDTYNTYLSSTGLVSNTTYYFGVAGIGNGGDITAYTVTAPTSTWARAAVFNNFTQVSTGSVILNWLPDGNPATTLYRVLVSTMSNMTPAVSSDTYNNYLSTAGLPANTTHYFSVMGINNNGVSTNTITASTSTWARAAVFNNFTQVSTGSVILNWLPNGNPATTLYRVLVSTMVSMTPAVSSDTYNNYLSTAGLPANTTHYFSVTGINNNGISTNTITASTSTWARAAVFDNFTQVSTGSLRLNWLPNSNPATTLYRVLVSTMVSMTPAVSSDTYNNYLSTAGLPANTTHYFSVMGINNNGVSTNTINASTSTWARAVVFNNFTQVSTGSLRLNWLPNGNPTTTLYRVLVSTMSNMTPAVSSDTYNNYLSTAGLAPNTTHYFSVTGFNNNGVSTNTITASTSTWARAAVLDSFTEMSTGSLRLNWLPDGNPATTLYRVLVSTASNMTPAVSSDTYNNYLSTAGLPANTTHYFSVTGINNNGVSTATINASTSTWARMALFNGFTQLSTGSVTLNWLPNSNPGNTLYRVLVSTMVSMTPAVSSDTYNNYLSTAGLPANTTHYFSVTGINNNGVSTTAVSASTSTWARAPASAVSTFSAVTESGFKASWTANSNPAGTLYVVQVSTAQDFNASASNQAAASTAPASGLSYTFSGRTPSTLYYFRARAVNNNGVTAPPDDYMQLGSVSTLALPPPAIGVVTEVTTNSVTAAWNLVASATGYTLATATSAINPPYPVTASSVTLGDLSATLYPLGVNTTYYLFVRAEGPGVSSSWSVFPATVTLARVPLTAVTTYTAVGYYGFTANWAPNSNPATTLYTVQASRAYDFDPAETDQVTFDTVPAAGTSATFSVLNPNTYYYFRVRAQHSAGSYTDWLDNLGYVKTKAQQATHAAGDGVLIYGRAGNTAQFRNYKTATGAFDSPVVTVPGAAGSLFVIKTSPLQSKQEAVAGYVENDTLHVLCTDGTNWTEEWTENVGGNASTRRFDIAYETNSGDVMVLYSSNTATNNELGYRTKPGSAECGSENWSANINLTAAQTNGVVQWVKMASDRRASSDTIAAVWADASAVLSAAIWNGTAWENERGTPLETILECINATCANGQDVEDFDVDFESGGNAMVVWANRNGNGSTNTNGAYYARWTELTRAWGLSAAISGSGVALADDAHDLDLAANPGGNEMVFASIGAASSDLQLAHWTGSVWISSGNADTTASIPFARTKLVAAGWISSGTITRSVIAYNDSATTNIRWIFGSQNGVFSAQQNNTVNPAFANPQKIYAMHQDPVTRDRLTLSISDNASDLIVKRLVMNTAGAFTWTDTGGGVALETNLATTTIGGFSYAYWAAPPVTTFDQSSYRFFANIPGTAVDGPLAAQDALAALGSTGMAFRLRTTLHIAQVDLPVSGQSFKLQFAGRGTGTCAEPQTTYSDVTGGTDIAFNDNAGAADGANLAGNAEDPRHGGHTNINQTYEELNDFTNGAAGILRNQDGLWDFALKDNGMTPGAVYCLRIIKADDSPLDGYDSYPEVLLHAPVYINEVYSPGAALGDWVELYNNTPSTPSLMGWALHYVQNSIDLGWNPNPVWTGQAGDVINAMSTFTITGLTLSGAAGNHVRLVDIAGQFVDHVQWPELAAGQSFARITDGNPTYFEIDPTPTPGYANSVSSDIFKISEISYGAQGSQFIEIYSTATALTRTLDGYTLRNSRGPTKGLFKLDRKIYPRNYTAIGFYSSDADGKTYAAAFGDAGLSAGGDFLTLENSTGSTVDTVTWEAGTNYTRYNYKASTAAFSDPAPGNAPYSLGRRDYIGNYAADFAWTSTATICSMNFNPAPLTGSLLHYPLNIPGPQYLARQFPVSMTFNADFSAGFANNIVFERTGGATDIRTPHIYRLPDIGFNMALNTRQTTAQYGLAFNDQDGYPLVSSAVYRVTFNSDNGTDAAPQIVLATVTYEAAVHAVTGSTMATPWLNNAARGGAIKLQIYNASPAGFNGLEVATVAFKLMNWNLEALTTQDARSLFNAVMLVRDSTSTGVYGLYEPVLDVSTIAYVPMAGIILDGGVSTLTVPSPDFAAASIPAASTGTFYLVFEATRGASGHAPYTFRVGFNPLGAVTLRDGKSDYAQLFTTSAQVDTSSITVIAPALPPFGSTWPYITSSSASITAAAGAYTGELSYYLGGPVFFSSRTYIVSTDGSLRAVSDSGDLLWTFTPASPYPINTSPEWQVENGKIYIYFSNDHGDVYKVWDRDTFTDTLPVWMSPLGTKITSGITGYGSKMFFGGADKKMHCIDKTTPDGAPCTGWANLDLLSGVSATPLVFDFSGMNDAWFGTEGGRLLHLNSAGGIEQDFYTGKTIKTAPFGDVGYANSSNRIFITSTDGKLYSATLDLGTVEEIFDAHAEIHSSPFAWSFAWPFGGPKYGPKYVYFGDDAGRLHKVSTDTWTEPDGWPFQAGGAIQTSPVVVEVFGALTPGEDYVYFGCDDGNIYAVNANTGARREGWPVSTGGPVRADPVVADTVPKALVVGSTDGRIYTLNIDAPQ